MKMDWSKEIITDLNKYKSIDVVALLERTLVEELDKEKKKVLEKFQKEQKQKIRKEKLKQNMTYLQLNHNSIKTHSSYQIFEDEKMVLVKLKNNLEYKAIPDIFSSITNGLYVNILTGVSLYPIKISEIYYSYDSKFNQLIINTIRKRKLKRVL